ncbi:hypothetical protein [Paracoccus jeotgali]|uniref:Uncharacterized protein n=1 Tax=Paracoccus jeotgali TaxID=2065379 RepID=A0A2K9MDC2_9RHOB|nr:hypothetical protein [Paracoccus jeotgali]AUM73036.1 hypothetical protein CYR75_00850 [Paracoccus jeotgali]
MTRALLTLNSGVGSTSLAVDIMSELRGSVLLAACQQGQTCAAMLRDLIGYPPFTEKGAPS